ELAILSDRILRTGIDELEALEPQLTADGPEERDALLPGFHQRGFDPRIDQVKREAGDSGPGTDVDQAQRPGRELREEQQRIDEEPMHDPAGVLEPRQVVHPVPLNE